MEIIFTFGLFIGYFYNAGVNDNICKILLCWMPVNLELYSKDRSLFEELAEKAAKRKKKKKRQKEKERKKGHL